MRVKCDCHHAYQDEKYGKGVRVATECKPQGNTFKSLRCTVCGKESSNESKGKK